MRGVFQAKWNNGNDGDEPVARRSGDMGGLAALGTIGAARSSAEASRGMSARTGAPAGGKPLAVLDGIKAALAALAVRLTPRYRPEKHYMRGPGPKCRAKMAASSDRNA